MAGHSKWAKIKRAKGANDAKKAVTLGKLAKQIIIAVKTGGGAELAHNFKLKAVIDKAKQAGMPVDTIKRAVDKGAGNSDEEDLKEITYEGYLPGGVAVMVMTATDNNNRTYSDIRNIFTKCAGSLGNSGCVAYMFNRRGEIHVEKPEKYDEEDLLNLAIEAGAEDLESTEDLLISCAADSLEEVSNNLTKLFETSDYKILESKDAMVAANTVTVVEPSDIKNIMKAMDMLEENDDVLDVVANFDIDEALVG